MGDKFFTYGFKAKEIVKFLNDIHKEIQDLTPLMKVARRFLKNTVDENFETSGVHTGEKWKSWSEKWKKQRIKIGRGSGKILNLEGELRRSIKAKHGKDFAQVGTASEYAAIHNFGFKGKVNKKSKKGKMFTAKMNMPKREFMRLNDTTIDELYAELYIAAKDLIFNQKR